MRVRSQLAGIMRSRRLDLSRLPIRDRSAARIGLVATVASGVGVVAVGSQITSGSEVRVTVIGDRIVLADWVVAVAIFGIGVAVYLLVASYPRRRWLRVLAAGAVSLLAVAMFEGGLQAASSLFAGGIPLLFRLGRVFALLAIGVAVGNSFAKPETTSPAWTQGAFAAAPFGLLGIAYFAAVWAGGPIDVVRAGLTGAISTIFLSFGIGLLMLATWQAIEGIHASMDGARALGLKVKTSWVTVAILVKVVLVVAATAFITAEASPDWERFRGEGPMAWAYALVLAAGLVTWVRSPPTGVTTRSEVGRAAVTLVCLFMLPSIVGTLIVIAGFVGLFAIPASTVELVGLLTVVVVAAATATMRSKNIIPSLHAWTAGSLLAIALLLPKGADIDTPLGGLESWFVDRLPALTEATSDILMPWQVAVLALAVAVPITSGLTRRRLPPTLVAIGAIGVWAAPRTMATASELIGGPTLARAPSPLTLDIAVTVVVAWAILYSLLARRRLPVDALRLGMVMAVFTAVTFIPKVGAPVLEGISRWVSQIADVDRDTLRFALVLTLPAVYGYLLDARELNKEPRSEPVLAAVGISCLVLAVAALQLAASGPDGLYSELIGIVFLPGLTILAAIVLAGSPSMAPPASNGPYPVAEPTVSDT